MLLSLACGSEYLLVCELVARYLQKANKNVAIARAADS